MAESLRLAIEKQICASLEAQIPRLAGATFRGRIWFGDDDPLPMVSLVEALNPDREPDSAGNQQVKKDRWILLLQGWDAEDVNNPTDSAHQLMAEVKTALGVMRREHGDGLLSATPLAQVADFIVEPGTVRPPGEISERALFWLRLILELTEDDQKLYWPP